MSRVEVEVAIVGAGAAGIAAGRWLHGRGRRITVLEAMARPGGRAHTIDAGGMALDLGCGWLHSAERNPLVKEAEAAGFVLDRSPAAWGKQLRNLAFPARDQQEAADAYAAFESALHATVEDDVASNAVRRGDRWRPYLDMISGALNGAELDCVSARDLLAYDDAASANNWRVPAGYGTLFASLAAQLPVTLATAVSRIDHAGARIALHTSRGIVTAEAVIVTIPTTNLARGAITFSPTLDEQLHAAACLPLGQVEKLFLSIDDADAVPPESHLVGDPRRADTGSYYLRPFGWPVIECFFGGIAARAIENMDADARAAFAREELGRLLGARFAAGLRRLASTHWSLEPTIGGAYSHALPGHADQRAVLARPHSERVLFAGEACSPHDFSTAHGAWQSGIEAARRVEACLR